MREPENDPMDPFIREWKDWLERPARKSAAEAAGEISAVLRSRPRGGRPHWLALAAAAAVVCLAVISVFTIGRRPREIRPAVVREAFAPLGNGEALIWLDERTPLYMTFQAPDTLPGSGGKR